MLKSIDRYILRQELAAYAAVLAIVSALLALENVPRIWNAVSETSQPLWLLGRMLLALLPEYLGVGLMLASFLAPAWVIRTLALRGEWQTLPAAGFGPARIMLVPFMIAALSTSAQMTTKMVLEPMGERVFEQLGRGLETGAFGLPIRLREFVALDERTTIYLTPGRDGRHFGQVFLHRGQDVFTARSANARRDARGRVEVELFDGRQIVHGAGRKESVLGFATYRFTFSPSAAAQAILPARDRVSQQRFSELLGDALGEGRADAPAPRPIIAALVTRAGHALFCMLLPWLALVLAQPPRRERSGGGLVLGIGAIVLFLRTSAFVETHFAHWPVTAALVHLGLWTGATAALVRFALTHDEGAIDHAINQALARLMRLGERLVERLPGRRRRVQATRSASSVSPA